MLTGISSTSTSTSAKKIIVPEVQVEKNISSK